jgi:hypothetical protein
MLPPHPDILPTSPFSPPPRRTSIPRPHLLPRLSSQGEMTMSHIEMRSSPLVMFLTYQGNDRAISLHTLRWLCSRRSMRIWGIIFHYLIQTPQKRHGNSIINPFITEPSTCRQKPPGAIIKFQLTRVSVRGRVPKAVAGRSNSSACPLRPILTSVSRLLYIYPLLSQHECMDFLMGPDAPPHLLHP